MFNPVLSHRVRRQLGALVALLTVALAVAGVAAAPAAAAIPADATISVSMVDFAFVPDPVVVNVGDTVMWSNDGMFPHTTTSDTAAWDSGTMISGDVFSFTFDTPGDFTYTCQIHPTLMTGTVSVVAAATSR